ncbi:MAG: hypothetical protein IT178_15575 [Acidobacteria bacterium]|nr:hypothetical protein [Acidobacteriota bacterium]
MTGRPEQGQDARGLASLCAAVERAAQAHRPAGCQVREVVVMLEETTPKSADGFVDVAPGYGHGI